MMNSLVKILIWTVGLATVFAFYAHKILALPSAITTPISAAIIAIGLISTAILGIPILQSMPAVTNERKLSVILMCLSIFLCVISTIAGLVNREMNLTDWGAFGVQVGTPFLLFMCPNRSLLMKSIGIYCVGFSLLDFGANVLDYFGVATFARHVGTQGSSGYGVHYLGVSDSSFAEGMVAFIACSFLSIDLPNAEIREKIFRISLIVILLFSLNMIHARTYLFMTIIAVPLLGIRQFWRIPPVFTMGFMIVASMYATFFDPGRDSEEVMRGWLVQDGWDAVGNHLFLGTGATYRDSSNIVARYQSLRGAGVTESGILDFAISYGVPAATLLVISALLAASGKKIFQTWPAVLLIVLTGSLAFAGSLSSFLGSILFWCSLIYCQRDEGVIMMQVMDQDHGKGLQPDRQITPSLEGVG